MACKGKKERPAVGGEVRWYAERAKTDQSLVVNGKAALMESMAATKIAFLCVELVATQRLSATWKAAAERAQLQASMAAEAAREAMVRWRSEQVVAQREWAQERRELQAEKEELQAALVAARIEQWASAGAGGASAGTRTCTTQSATIPGLLKRDQPH
jgi:hypothetical protein